MGRSFLLVKKKKRKKKFKKDAISSDWRGRRRGRFYISPFSPDAHYPGSSPAKKISVPSALNREEGAGCFFCGERIRIIVCKEGREERGAPSGLGRRENDE